MPGAKAFNFYEESQIAKIYGMTEDYTPPKRYKTPYMIYAEHVSNANVKYIHIEKRRDIRR